MSDQLTPKTERGYSLVKRARETGKQFHFKTAVEFLAAEPVSELERMTDKMAEMSPGLEDTLVRVVATVHRKQTRVRIL